MRIKVLGGGFYGCHIALSFILDGHDVELHEISDKLFNGASGNIPARLHCGSHYPRSKLTRDACKEHYAEFMTNYGDITSHVPINIYAVAEYDSYIDFGTYKQILTYDIPYIPIFNPKEFGLENIEGAILTGERHIHIDEARKFFWEFLKNNIILRSTNSSNDFDLTVDCTFCALENVNVNRFEVCLTVLLEGPIHTAVTVMDGPFPSLYPWNEDQGICSLSSAKWTPMGRYDNWDAANYYLNCVTWNEVRHFRENMVEQMSFYYPAIREYKFAEDRLAIRALPRSAADARLVDLVKNDKTISIRAGKIDAIFHAYREIQKIIGDK